MYVLRNVAQCGSMWLILSFQTVSESVTSIEGGVVSAPGYDEIVCATYAGMEGKALERVTLHFRPHPIPLCVVCN